MSESIPKPWILSYALNVAETAGADLTRVKREEKSGRRVQIIDFITYPREGCPEDVIWARVSDKNFCIPVKFSKKCIAEYISVEKAKGDSEEEPRFTTQRYAIVVISGCKLVFTKIPLQNAQGLDEVYHLALEVDHVHVVGSAGEGTFANPKDLEEDNDICLWVNGLRAGDGSGNILRDEKKAKSRTGTDLAKKKKVAQNQLPFAPKNPSEKSESKVFCDSEKRDTREADEVSPSTTTSRIKERRAKSAVHWEHFENNLFVYSFIPDHYVVQHNDILVFGQDREGKCDTKDQTTDYYDDIAPLPDDFLVSFQGSSLKPKTKEVEIQSTPLDWPPSDDEEMLISTPQSQASHSAESNSDDERDASDVRDSMVLDEPEDDEEENDSPSTQGAEEAFESERENDISIPKEPSPKDKSKLISSLPLSTANEDPEGDANDAFATSHLDLSTVMSQPAVLHKKGIQVLVPDSDVSMSGSQSQSQNMSSLPLPPSQSQSQPQPKARILGSQLRPVSQEDSLPIAGPRVLVADSSQSQHASQEDSQATKSSKTESDSQPYDSLLFANNTYPSPVAGNTSVGLLNENAIAGPSTITSSQEKSVAQGSAKSTSRRRNSESVRTSQPAQQIEEGETDDKAEQLNAPVLDEDDLRIHNMLTSSLGGSSSNVQLPQKVRGSSASSKATVKQELRRKRTKNSDEEVERRTDASLSSSGRPPQKKRRRLSHSRQESAAVSSSSEVPQTRNKENNVERPDGYTVARVDHDVNAWKAPSFAQNLGASSSSKSNAPLASVKSSTSTLARERASTSISMPRFSPSSESIITTASKKSKKSDTQTTRGESVLSVESRGDIDRSRTAQISSSTPSRKTTVEKLPPALRNPDENAKPTNVSPSPLPRLNVDLSSINRESGPKWMTWSEAADVLVLIGRLRDVRGDATR